MCCSSHNTEQIRAKQKLACPSWSKSIARPSARLSPRACCPWTTCCCDISQVLSILHPGHWTICNRQAQTKSDICRHSSSAPQDSKQDIRKRKESFSWKTEISFLCVSISHSLNVEFFFLSSSRFFFIFSRWPSFLFFSFLFQGRTEKNITYSFPSCSYLFPSFPRRYHRHCTYTSRLGG